MFSLFHSFTFGRQAAVAVPKSKESKLPPSTMQLVREVAAKMGVKCKVTFENNRFGDSMCLANFVNSKEIKPFVKLLSPASKEKEVTKIRCLHQPLSVRHPEYVLISASYINSSISIWMHNLVQNYLTNNNLKGLRAVAKFKQHNYHDFCLGSVSVERDWSASAEDYTKNVAVFCIYLDKFESFLEDCGLARKMDSPRDGLVFDICIVDLRPFLQATFPAKLQIDTSLAAAAGHEEFTVRSAKETNAVIVPERPRRFSV